MFKTFPGFIFYAVQFQSFLKDKHAFYLGGQFTPSGVLSPTNGTYAGSPSWEIPFVLKAQQL
jgi:hypothetical protein